MPGGLEVRRLPGNPVIVADRAASIGDNVNGPSVIRVPDWVTNPLGRYYLYFAHHRGRHIRLAFADAPGGPWRVHAPGCLNIAETPAFQGHIASPDVHVDHEARRIRMYFHGRVKWGLRQATGVALSRDGVGFKASRELLGPFYFRVFRHDGRYFAFAKAGAGGYGELLASDHPDRGFRSLGKCVPGMRHAAVWVTGERLRLVFSRIGDRPERLLVSTLDLARDPRDWPGALGEPEELLAPEVRYEGGELALVTSRAGMARRPERALRDPFVFSDAGRDYLFYAVQGEQGIAVAEILSGGA